ncbi:MAG TPA: penicillin acylase family protein [Nannocystaceae bacterium]|nr:penicillin acylase family protein [Nannocystaceae bacterium]
MVAVRLAFVLAALALVGCSDPGEDHLYRAEIRWTTYGIPHITGDDVPSVLFGQGWAHARDAGCIVADQIVKVRSERSSFFGPGEADANLDSDFAHLALGIYAKAEAAFPEQPQEIQDAITAYAAGWNLQLEESGEAWPCAGEPWVRPIEPVDLFAHYIELGTLASGRQLSAYIATAQPPSSKLEREPPPISSLKDPRIGSNGWAIGKDRAAAGRGMLVANPHFPWEGELKLWESHLRVGDELDIYGVSLIGVLGVLIGFNEHVGWTHTVSDGQRFTFYSLTLDPADPTRYMYDGDWRALESTTYEIQVAQEGGGTAPVSRTMWRSHYGPVLNVPPFGWGSDLVLTYRDANANNTELIAQFLGMNRAQSLAELQRVHEEVNGIPWVNTMATSAEGKAWYADTTPTPNLSQPAIDRWLELVDSGDFLTSALAANDVVLLDGADPLFEWVEEPGAREPGLVPYARVPKLERDDFVFNANDSHWLSNPAAPLEGFSPLHGFERTPRSPRTRTNAMVLTETGAASMAGPDGKFDLAELQAAILSNRGSVAELLRDEVVARGAGAGPVATEYLDAPVEVDVGPACSALAAWDLRLDLDSAGALVFRELLGEYPDEQLADAGLLFANAFDADDPIATPNGLAPADADGDFALEALARAVLKLEDAGLTPDATLRMAQFTKKGDMRIPIHGGGRKEGVTNIVVYDVFKTTMAPSMTRGEVIGDGSTDLTTEGYVVNYGSSFVMTLQYTDDGPRAAAFLTYSESDDPSSPHFADQTPLFSDKAWRPILYREDDIAAAVEDERVVTGD